VKGPVTTSAAMYFAHAGHWLTGIAYFLPVLAFMVWLGITQIRERRGRGGPDGG
jgi:hypothetical protein